MTTTEFEEHVKDHTKPYVDLQYAALGLNGEAGEVAEWVKKVVLRNNPKDLTDEDLKGELGDVLWYLTAIVLLKGWTLSETMDRNKVKLDGRRAANFKMVV